MAATKDRYLLSKRAAMLSLRGHRRNPDPDSQSVKISQQNKFKSREFGGVEHGKIYKKTNRSKYGSLPDYVWGTYF